MTRNVRTATLADIDSLARLFDEYRVFYEQDSNTDLARSFLTARLENGESTIFLATDDTGRDCGFTQLFPSFSSVAAQPIWVLNDLYVDAAARKTGVGRRLMNRARDFARDTGTKGILLETAKTNRRAQALYESLGYEANTGSYYYFLDLSSSPGPDRNA